MTISYSQRSDVLYITLETCESPCVYVEKGMGMVVRVSEADQRVVGVTIRDFLRHVSDGDELSIPGLDRGLPIGALSQLAEAS